MINSIKKILFLLTLKQKKKSLFFLILLFFSTVLEGISLALIFPLVKIISDKEYLLELNSKLPILNLTSVEPDKIEVYLVFEFRDDRDENTNNPIMCRKKIGETNEYINTVGSG